MPTTARLPLGWTEQLNGKAFSAENTPDVIRPSPREAAGPGSLWQKTPHQSAAFYRLPNADAHSLVNAEQLNGKELSYNNILDTDACWTLAREFDEPARGYSEAPEPLRFGYGRYGRRGLRQSVRV